MTPSSATTASSNPAPLGLFGGTFDPPHNGHLHIAHTALATLPVANIRWIPSGDPGHRAAAPGAAGGHRLAMVRLAVAQEPRFSVDDAEIASAVPTFTVPTLERLRTALGAHRPLILISGADSFLSLPHWLRWQEVFSFAHIAVAARPGFTLSQDAMDPALRAEFTRRTTDCAELARTPAGQIALFALPPLPVSATAIRERLRRGERTADLLPAAVQAYIDSHHLYNP